MPADVTEVQEKRHVQQNGGVPGFLHVAVRLL